MRRRSHLPGLLTASLTASDRTQTNGRSCSRMCLNVRSGALGTRLQCIKQPLFLLACSLGGRSSGKQMIMEVKAGEAVLKPAHRCLLHARRLLHSPLPSLCLDSVSCRASLFTSATLSARTPQLRFATVSIPAATCNSSPQPSFPHSLPPLSPSRDLRSCNLSLFVVPYFTC